MLLDRTHFRFFGNKEINALYATIGLLYFGEGLVSVFVPVYFWKLGYPFWQILFFYFLNSLFFTVLTLAVLPLLARVSDKMMMFLSIPFLVLYFLALQMVPVQPWFFYLAPFLLACNMLLFNVGYNLDFTKAIDDKRLGREVGTRYTVGALVQFSAPFFGGAMIAFFGFSNLFFAVSVILFLAVVPLFFFPHHHIASGIGRAEALRAIAEPALLPLNLSAIGYAMETMVGRVVWPFFIFLVIGNIEEFGGVVSAGLLASAIATYFVGFLSDSGKRRRALAWTASLFALVWVLRLFVSTAPAAVGSHVAGNIVNAALMVAWASQLFKTTRLSPNPSMFILGRELLYQIARIFFLPVLMLLSAVLPMNLFFTASFGLGAVLSLFYLFANKFHSHDIAKG